jgi:hypothetical protein
MNWDRLRLAAFDSFEDMSSNSGLAKPAGWNFYPDDHKSDYSCKVRIMSNGDQ